MTCPRAVTKKDVGKRIMIALRRVTGEFIMHHIVLVNGCDRNEFNYLIEVGRPRPCLHRLWRALSEAFDVTDPTQRPGQ